MALLLLSHLAIIIDNNLALIRDLVTPLRI